VRLFDFSERPKRGAGRTDVRKQRRKTLASNHATPIVFGVCEFRRPNSIDALIKKARQQEVTTMAASGDADKRQQHWSKTRSLTIVMLILWVIFSFVLPWYAHALNSVSFMGFPLGFYFTAQGSLIAFVVMIFVQNWFQDKIDDEFGMGEE
jgi:putative solute:sodium symporter small subunit